MESKAVVVHADRDPMPGVANPGPHQIYRNPRVAVEARELDGVHPDNIRVKMLYAGRVSESMFCSDISSGAQDDIHRATDLLNKMVREWGMSDRVGPISFADSEEKLYGGEVIVSKSYSDATAVEIDQEIARIARECYAAAERLLTENRETLGRIAEALLKYEVLDAADVDEIMAGHDPSAAVERSKRPTTPTPFRPPVENAPAEPPPIPRKDARPASDGSDLPGMK